MRQHKSFTLRLLAAHEVDQAHALELACYPAAAAATREAFVYRQQVYNNLFWSAWSADGQLIGLACGVRTFATDCSSEAMKGMEADAPDGPRLCVLSVAVAQARRHAGVGSALMRALLSAARDSGLTGVILMCEAQLIPFYERLQFVYRGPSASTHGGIVWHEMQLEFRA